MYFFLLFGIIQCVDPDRIEAVKQEMISEAIANHKLDKKNECRDEVYIKANGIVDSIMIEMAIFEKVDTFIKPPRPIKPEYREPNPPKDSSPIQRILN